MRGATQERPRRCRRYHDRGHALTQLKRLDEAIDDFSAAVRLRPDDAHLLDIARVVVEQQSVGAGERSGLDSQSRGCACAFPPRSRAGPCRAPLHQHTGRCPVPAARQCAQAIGTLERSLAAGRGAYDGFDLFFLAMAHHRQGHREQAACFNRASHWLETQKGLSEHYSRELAAFRAEAEMVLSCPGGELPADVFARPR